jgi:hypothetical protein
MSLGRNDEQGRPFAVVSEPEGEPLGRFNHARVVVTDATANSAVSFATTVTLVPTASGSVRITTAGGETVNCANWPAHLPIPVGVATVYNSAAFASNFLAMW